MANSPSGDLGELLASELKIDATRVWQVCETLNEIRKWRRSRRLGLWDARDSVLGPQGRLIVRLP
jgi:hypothetical protein